MLLKLLLIPRLISKKLQASSKLLLLSLEKMHLTVLIYPLSPTQRSMPRSTQPLRKPLRANKNRKLTLSWVSFKRLFHLIASLEDQTASSRTRRAWWPVRSLSSPRRDSNKVIKTSLNILLKLMHKLAKTFSQNLQVKMQMMLKISLILSKLLHQKKQNSINNYMIPFKDFWNWMLRRLTQTDQLQRSSLIQRA